MRSSSNDDITEILQDTFDSFIPRLALQNPVKDEPIDFDIFRDLKREHDFEPHFVDRSNYVLRQCPKVNEILDEVNSTLRGNCKAIESSTR